jgi:hypothetical protein
MENGRVQSYARIHDANGNRFARRERMHGWKSILHRRAPAVMARH